MTPLQKINDVLLDRLSFHQRALASIERAPIVSGSAAQQRLKILHRHNAALDELKIVLEKLNPKNEPVESQVQG